MRRLPDWWVYITRCQRIIRRLDEEWMCAVALPADRSARRAAHRRSRRRVVRRKPESKRRDEGRSCRRTSAPAWLSRDSRRGLHEQRPVASGTSLRATVETSPNVIYVEGRVKYWNVPFPSNRQRQVRRELSRAAAAARGARTLGTRSHRTIHRRRRGQANVPRHLPLLLTRDHGKGTSSRAFPAEQNIDRANRALRCRRCGQGEKTRSRRRSCVRRGSSRAQ